MHPPLAGRTGLEFLFSDHEYKAVDKDTVGVLSAWHGMSCGGGEPDSTFLDRIWGKLFGSSAGTDAIVGT